MSRIHNKGKTLTTKRKPTKLSSKEKKNQQDFGNNTALFDSFVSVRTSKPQKDVSLLNENSSNSPIAYENETDVFKFPGKTNSYSGEDNIILETTVPLSPQKNIFDEETKIENSINDLCSESKPEEYTPNESSLFFESNSKRNSKNCNNPPMLKNNNKTSKDERIEDTSFDDILPIPDISHVKKSSPNTVTGENLPDETEDSKNDANNQCPVCLKTIGSTKYLSHMKSCAAKNKLSTQQLLAALKLHKKQLAERKELGLGIPVQSFKDRVSPKRLRTNDRKGAVDSSLQLALALSASLQSAQEVEVIQEAEALQEAGLSDEAEQRLSTLEKYGFASALPRCAPGGPKSRPLPPSLLLRRTQEERERIVTEKVAIVLISEEESMNPTSFPHNKPVLKSKVLKEKWDIVCRLWSKSCCSEDEKREAFYVESLSQFVSPSTGDVGEGLRRLSQLPGRMNTPEEDCLSEEPAALKTFVSEEEKQLKQLDETDISELPTPLRSDVVGRGRKFHANTQCQTNIKTFSTLRSLSEDWGKLVDNGVLSDIKIRCKEFVVIPAHKLVFYVRCPRILDEAVKHGNGEDILDWGNVSVDSVLAFLEFVYCGKKDKIFMLDTNDFLNIKRIADRLDYTELKNHLSGANNCLSQSTMSGVKKNLFKSDYPNKVSDNVAEYLDSGDQRVTSDSSFSEYFSRNNSEKRSSLSLSSLNSENIYSGRESLDMFGDSSITVNKTEPQHERDDLDILVSLIGKPTQHKINSNEKCNYMEKSEIMVIGSPAGSSASDICHGKRKASNISLSEDEDISLSKKRCSDVSRSERFESKDRGETFDLTQSSNSSNEVVLEEVNEERSLEGSENAISRTRNREEEFDLTQSSKSSNGGVCDSSKCKRNIPEESDGYDSLVDLTQTHCDESISKNCAVSPTSNEVVIDPVWDGFHHEDCNYNVDKPKTSPVKPVENRPMSDITTLSTPQFHPSEMINSSKCSPTCLSSGGKSQSRRFVHSPSSISGKETHDEVLSEENNVQDYIDPVWEGFDDYYQYNCANTSLKTPMKYHKDKSLNMSLPISLSLEKSKSKQSSLSPKSCKTDMSSSNKSPRKLTQTVLSPLNNSPKSIKSISSDSKSPKVISRKRVTPKRSPSIKYVLSDSKSSIHLSQEVLNDYSPMPEYNSQQIHYNLSMDESPIEIIPERSSPDLPDPHTTEYAKSRKNLTFQFEGCSFSSQRTYLENEGENPSRNVVAQQLQCSSDAVLCRSPKYQNTPTKFSLRKDSLAAMQRLLDDSFEVNDSLFDSADALASGNNEKEPGRQSKRFSGRDCVIAGNSRSKTTSAGQDNAMAGSSRCKTSLDTPSPGIIVSDKVTPLPDYSGMKTPALKKELSRFGLKPSLGRRKAKLLLRYIYDQTHPVVPDPEGGECEFKPPEGRPPRSPVKSPRKSQSTVASPRKAKASESPTKTQTTVNLDDSGSESDDPCSQMSTSSSVSSISSAASLPEESYHEAEDYLTQDLSDSGDVHSCIRSLIKGDPELHRKVLMYEPVYLEDLVAMLKARGIKGKANDVMDFLDEQCITFRTNSWKATNEKRRQKQKSPKKKMKPQAADSSISPSIVQAQVTKKRGRPRKTNI